MKQTQFSGQKVTELELDSGETVYVKPLSVFILLALQDKAAQQFPYPDPKAYEKAIDDSKTLEPGQVVPAEHNPDYVALKAQIDAKRQGWVNRQVVFVCVEVEDRQAMIEKYADELKQLGTIIDLPDDPWQATLYRVINSSVDYTRVTQFAINNLQVQEVDIRNGWRIFQPTVSRSRSVGRGEKPESSDIQPAKSHES